MIATDDPDGPLLPLAEKIAEGTTVDPVEEIERLAPDSDRHVLKALLDIAAIEAAHRNAERDFSRLEDGPADLPRQWGHLTILEKISEGEFGEVYRAYDSKLQIDVALKLAVVEAGQLLDASRALDEARLMARVRHENVVRVYGADRRQGRVGLWMDLVRGRTLEQQVDAQGFGASEAADVGIKLCRALAAVHSVGVLHGDIKAHNVVREDGSGRIILVDFGAGRPLAAEPGKGRDIVGTPVYMAPEVLNDQPRSTASDIYSLGVLLFHLVTADYPVYAASRAAFIEAHRTDARKRLRDLRPDLPERFIQVVERATATEPKARYASAGAFETDLIHLLAPPTPAPPAPSPLGNWRLWAVAAMVLLSLAGIATWRWNRSAAPTAASTPSDGPAVPSEPPADPYLIDATFYRVNGTAGKELLGPGQTVKVKDQLSLSVTTSAPIFLYVVNEDERDEAYLLFPLPGQSLTNPLPANRELRVPAEYNWQISSAGGREHFVVFASRERLSAFEEAFRLLPSPRVGGPVQGQRLPPETVDKLPRPKEEFRGVGSITPIKPGPPPSVGRFSTLFTQPLNGKETAEGMWARQLTLDNASRPR